MNKVVKGLIITAFMVLGMTKGFGSELKFEIKSDLKKASGTFKKFNVKLEGNKISGSVKMKSLTLNKNKEERGDLLEYFDVEDHPLTKFKGVVKGNKVTGEYTLKGDKMKLDGTLVRGKMSFKIPLKKLVGGFKAMLLSDKDHVEIKMDVKK